MVQRVNFLQHSKYALTYQNMALAFAGVILLCCAVYGGIILQGAWVQTKLLAKKELHKALAAEFEKQAQLAQASKRVERTGTAIHSLSSIFERLPQWSQALDALADAVPTQVWLTNLKTTVADVGATVRHIEVEGRGRNAEAITQFVQRLDARPFFENVVLSRSTRDAELHDLIFTIAADVGFAALETSHE